MTVTSTDMQDIDLHPADVLLNLIVLVLAPMFFSASGGNIAFARMAALETVTAYRARHHADLIAVAQIIAFGLAALGSLSLSMAEDISLSMTLRLRSNANALNRSAEQNRRAMKQKRPDTAPDQSEWAQEVEPEQEAAINAAVAEATQLVEAAHARIKEAPAPEQPPKQSPTTAPLPASTQKQEAIQLAGMLAATADCSTNLSYFPPTDSKKPSVRTAALNSSANTLMLGTVCPPPAQGAQTAASLLHPK